MKAHLLSLGLILAGLSGCGPSYSPDTYASNAVQQANKVEQGVVVGVRGVAVTASGTTGAVTGAAAGGIAGSQMGTGATSAFASLGGALVGGIAGTAAEHVAADTTAFEYIVRKANGDLVSVTQKDKTPLALGQHVLVIAGNQARVVPDYTVVSDTAQAKPDKAAQDKAAQDKAAQDKAAQDKAAEPAKPADSGKPADTAAPADSTKAAEPAKPADASKPAEPDAKPADAPAADAKPAETTSAAALPVKVDDKLPSPADLAKSVGVTLP